MMKVLVSGLALSFTVIAADVRAEVMLNVDGETYALSTLMDHCQSMADDPLAQVACFSAVSDLVEQQSSGEQASDVSVPDALNAFRAVAHYEDENTGLLISGDACNIQLVYFNNYFHISRRNVSSIDLFSAQFDASKLDFDGIIRNHGGPAPLSRGVIGGGETAATIGGVAMESTQFNFEPKSARSSLGDYAIQVVDQVAPTESQQFDFVLIHPAKQQSSAEIWSAFDTYVTACQG